jgi:predicted secreted protein
MIHIDDNFDGRTLAIRIGEIVELTLAENASTGYRWDFANERSSWSAVLRLLEEQAGATDTRPGMPGTRRFLLEAVAPGDAELELEYLRPWQRSTPPARTFRALIEVQPAR